MLIKNKSARCKSIFAWAVLCLTAIASLTLNAPAQTPAKPCFDFTGTGRTSFATTIGNNSGPLISWNILSNGGDNSVQTYDFGRGSLEFSFRDGVTPGYFDGDNKADAAVLRLSGSSSNLIDFYVRPSTQVVGNPGANYGVRWGASPDRPALGDYDGDGRDDLTIVRTDAGALVWWILYSATNTYSSTRFGSSADLPISGADYNGDGRAEITVLRLAANQPTVYFAGDSLTGAIVQTQQWGNNTDSYIVGDYIGDRRADFAVRRRTSAGAPAASSTWYILENGGSNQIVTRTFGYGSADPNLDAVDYSLCGDYNGDGKQDIAIYRYTDKVFYWLNSPDFNTFSAQAWGNPNGLNYPLANLRTFNNR